MKLLQATVRAATTIPDLYRQHAGLKSIDHYLADWQRAHDLLGKRIHRLQLLRNERRRQIINGEWPAKKEQSQ